MIDQIRPAQIAAWMEMERSKGKTPYVLDVREPHELQRASVNTQGIDVLAIPMGTVPSRLAELDSGQPVACLCHHGARSLQVANFLVSHGFDTVINIAGGIDAWSTEVDTTLARY